MAYIATKATYIGEEEILDENRNPVVDENGVPVKRIQTDVDDVIFAEGEVIVLIEAINEGKHFDLNIEDEGSKYFAPTQIKIGDGLHSFKELNWLQTIDSNKIDIAVDNSMQKVVGPIMSDFDDLKITVDTFINKDAHTILLELVKNNYFTLNSENGVLSCFSSDDNLTNKTLRTLSIGYGNNINTYSADSKLTSGNSVFFGDNNSILGVYNYAFGLRNSIYGNYNLAIGHHNTINRKIERQPETICFGSENIIMGHSNKIFGATNIIRGSMNVCMGNNNNYGSTEEQKIIGSCIFGTYNQVYGKNHFIAGNENDINQSTENVTVFGKNIIAKYSSSFICGQNNKTDIDTWFCIGNGTDSNKRSNIFYIGKNGSSELNSNFTINGDLKVRGIYEGEQLTDSIVGFYTTPTKNLYRLSLNGASTNATYFKGIYEIIIIPKDQSIKSVHDISTGNSIQINQPFFKVYDGYTPFQLQFTLVENAAEADVYIIIQKISDYGE